MLKSVYETDSFCVSQRITSLYSVRFDCRQTSISMVRPSRTSAETKTKNIFTIQIHFLILTWPAIWPWPSFAVAPETGHMHISHIVENNDRHETNGYPPAFDLLADCASRVHVYACVCVCVAFSQGIGCCTPQNYGCLISELHVNARKVCRDQRVSVEVCMYVRARVCVRVCETADVRHLCSFAVTTAASKSKICCHQFISAIFCGVQWMFNVAQQMRLEWIERF